MFYFSGDRRQARIWMIIAVVWFCIYITLWFWGIKYQSILISLWGNDFKFDTLIYLDNFGKWFDFDCVHLVNLVQFRIFCLQFIYSEYLEGKAINLETRLLFLIRKGSRYKGRADSYLQRSVSISVLVAFCNTVPVMHAWQVYASHI